VGGSWLEERWGERQEAGPVWRVEFQIRRAALAGFKVRSPAEVLAAAQALWTYGTGDWLTLRRPTSGLAGWRWPLEASWAELQGVRIAPTGSEAVRRRLAEADRERALRFLQGHLTTWGALGEVDEIEDVLRTARAAVVGYLAERGRTFRDEVRHKRARRRVVEAAAGRQRSPEGHKPNRSQPLEVGGGSGPHPGGCEGDGGERSRRSRRRENDRGGEQPPKEPEGHEPNLSVSGRWSGEVRWRRANAEAAGRKGERCASAQTPIGAVAGLVDGQGAAGGRTKHNGGGRRQSSRRRAAARSRRGTETRTEAGPMSQVRGEGRRPGAAVEPGVVVGRRQPRSGRRSGKVCRGRTGAPASLPANRRYTFVASRTDACGRIIVDRRSGFVAVNRYQRIGQKDTAKVERLSDTWSDFARILLSAGLAGKFRTEETDR